MSEPSVSPVIIETEVMPAATVELDATHRSGERLYPSGQRILSAVAVRMPLRLREHSGNALKHDISAAADFEMALYSGESSTNWTRWALAGWLQGSAIDLSIIVQSAPVPDAVIDHASDVLTTGVPAAVTLLGEIVSVHSGAMDFISGA